jgi:hypothetical protein
MPKCIEITCNNKGTNAVTTYDGQKIYVCNGHLSTWVENGATTRQSILKVNGRVLKRYGPTSTVFLIGFSLIIYNVYINHNTTVTSIPSFVGLLLLILSWIIFCDALKRAYSKVKGKIGKF